MRHRDRVQVLRTRNQDLARKRKLENSLCRLSLEEDRSRKILQRRINQTLEENKKASEIYHGNGLETPSRAAASNHQLTPPGAKEHLPPLLDVEQSSRGVKRYRAEETLCRFDNTRHCSYFPCISGGKFTVSLSRYPHKHSNGEAPPIGDSPVEQTQKLITDLESASVRRPLKSLVDQNKMKERALKRVLQQIHSRLEDMSGQDKNVNYGATVPRRRVSRLNRSV